MKKICLFMFACTTLIGLTGCGSNNVEGSLEELMTKMYSDIKEDERPMVANTEVTSENIEYYLGTSDIEYEEALASEPMMSSIAHSVVLVRLPDGQNAEEFASKMRSNADPRKWICVEAEAVKVSTKGNLVLLVMSSEDRVNKITSKFLK